MAEIYYDLITAESDYDYENAFINAEYTKIINNVNRKLRLNKHTPQEFTPLEELALVALEIAIGRMQAEDKEEMDRKLKENQR